MERKNWIFCLGIFLGYSLVYAFKYLNANLLWTFFYR